MRTGCVEKVVLAVLDPALRSRLAGLLEGLGLRLEVLPGEEPLDFYRVARLASRDAAPESILVVTDASVVIGLEEARARIGLVKLLRVRGCSVEDVVASVRAVSCESIAAPCPVDAGLGWLQA